MNRPLGRNEDVNDALAQAAPPLAAGGEAADTFEALYRRTFPRVYGYVASLLRDRSAAEDVTAQAFERAYRKRRSFRASRRSAEAWMFGIARNAALDALRVLGVVVPIAIVAFLAWLAARALRRRQRESALG